MATIPLILLSLAMLRWPIGPLAVFKKFCETKSRLGSKSLMVRTRLDFRGDELSATRCFSAASFKPR